MPNPEILSISGVGEVQKMIGLIKKGKNQNCRSGSACIHITEVCSGTDPETKIAKIKTIKNNVADKRTSSTNF